MSTNSITTLKKRTIVRNKIWTYNLNIFRVSLYHWAIRTEFVKNNNIFENIFFIFIKNIFTFIFIKFNTLYLKVKLVWQKIIFFLETSGLDPEITICKIAVLPVKLYPHFYRNIVVKLYHHFNRNIIKRLCIYLYLN